MLDIDIQLIIHQVNASKWINSSSFRVNYIMGMNKKGEKAIGLDLKSQRLKILEICLLWSIPKGMINHDYDPQVDNRSRQEGS